MLAGTLKVSLDSRPQEGEKVAWYTLQCMCVHYPQKGVIHVFVDAVSKIFVF